MFKLRRGLAVALLTAVAVPAWADTTSPVLTTSWQDVAANGSLVEVQNTGSQPVYLTTGPSVPTATSPGTMLQSGERLCRTLTTGDLYARGIGTVSITTGLSCGGGGGGGAITGPLGPSTAAASSVAVAFGSGSTLPAFASPPPVLVAQYNSTLPTYTTGTNAPVSTDVNGRTIVTGSVATGSTLSGNPLLIGGSDGTNVRNIGTDTSGNLSVAERGSSTSGGGITPVVAINSAGVVVQAAGANVYDLYATNATATVGWLIGYNATTVPTGGASLTTTLILDCIALPASGTAGKTYIPGPPKRYGTGFTLLVSSTSCAVASPVYTTGTVTAYLSGEFR